MKNTRKNLSTSTFSLGMSPNYNYVVVICVIINITCAGVETEVPVANKGIRHIPGKSTFTIGTERPIVDAYTVIIQTVSLYDNTGHVEPVPSVNENVNSAANRRRNAGGGASTLQLF